MLSYARTVDQSAPVAVAHGRGRNAPALIGDRGWLAVLCVAAASVALGLLFAGRHDGTRRCFVVGVNGREIALALVMAGTVFPSRLVRAAVLEGN